jgi:hypothetical protein
MPSPPEDESGDPGLAECLRLLEAVPAAAASCPAFRRHWPSISASLAALSDSLTSHAVPPASPLLAPLAAALRALLSVSAAGDAPRLGHLHTVSLLSSTAATLSQLAADARLLAAPATSGADHGSAADLLVSRLRLGSAASRAAALDELASAAPSLPEPSAAAAVSAVAELLDSGGGGGGGDLRERAVAALAALACSDAARPALAQEAGAVVPHLCRALESGSSSGAEHACAALLPLTAASRDAVAAVAARGGVAALLAACAGGTPAAQAAAAGVLRNLAAFPDLRPALRDEGALPMLLQLVSLGTPRARELALGCLQSLTAGDDDGDEEGQRLKVEAFQAGALGCVRDFLDGSRGDEAGLAPALGLLRNMASFRYIAEIAAASGGFAAHVAAALGSDRSATRTEAALALAELFGNAGGVKAGRHQHEAVAADCVPRLVWMMEAKAPAERDAAARALAALLAASGGCRRAFRKDERGVVNAVQLLDPGARAVDRRFPVSVLLAVAPSRRCRKQMVAAGACGFLQGLVAAEVEGAKRLAEWLGKGKMLGVFPRT